MVTGTHKDQKIIFLAARKVSLLKWIIMFPQISPILSLSYL